MTLREAVSVIRGRHKFLSSDIRITDRVVAAELKATAALLIKRDTDKRRLWNSDTIFTTIPCLDLIEVPITECCEYTSEKTIRRSKHKLPKLGEGNYNHILYVYNIENSKRISEITPNRYINLLKLRPKSQEKYFWIENGYLYVTDSDVRVVKIRGYFEGDVPTYFYVDEGCDACECNKTLKPEDLCTNPLDLEFKCPSYLNKSAFDMASEILLNTYHKLKEEVTSDEKAGN